MRKVFIAKNDYRTYYQYRKTIKGFRDGGWIVRNACGGVWCFESAAEYDVWKNQK